MGSYRPVAEALEDSYVYYRTHGDQTVLVALSFSGKDRVLELADPRAGRVLLSTWLDREEQVLLSHCTLRGHEGIIVQLEPEPD
jgi:hypothetical protein